jgi:nucleoside-diphosphate-sugar epimerase
VRVFVAGATGAIGRALLPKLVAAGHEVTGLTRSEDRAASVRATGAGAVVCDVFDVKALRAAMTAFAPEVVVHELTALPYRLNYRDRNLYAATNRLRGEGTRILLDAAIASGARRMVVQSVAFVGENTDPSTMMGAANATILAMEDAVTASTHLQGVALRYGFFYGPGTHYGEHGSIAREVRRRRYPVVGRGEWVIPFVHVDDAADATAAAAERGSPGVYDVVDDEPAIMREWVPAYAEALGAKKPFRVPEWVARLIIGKEAVDAASRLKPQSNEKARRELGWQPRWASWREGFFDAPR